MRENIGQRAIDRLGEGHQPIIRDYLCKIADTNRAEFVEPFERQTKRKADYIALQ